MKKLYNIKEFKKLLLIECITFEGYGGEWKKIVGWFNLALGKHKAAKKMDLLKYLEIIK